MNYDYFPTCCVSAGLPLPEKEFRFCLRKWRFDYAFVTQKIALEIQGGIWRKKGGAHKGVGAMRDIEKFSEAAILGWRIIYCTPADMRSLKVMELLRRALT